MKKIFKNNSGFTLVELLMAAGIASLIGMIAYSNFKSSNDVGTRTLIGSETTYLKNLVISNMSNPIACENTFKGRSVALNSALEIKDKNNLVILKQGMDIGVHKKNLFKITKVTSVEAANSKNSLVVFVEYELSPGITKAVSTKSKSSFTVNVFINRSLPPNNNIVNNCMVDTTQLLIDAIKSSCQGGGAHYVAPTSPVDTAYPNGRCVHEITVTLPTETKKVTTAEVIKCPAGYFFGKVTTPPESDLVNGGITNYTCKKMTTAPECNPGFYLKSISAEGVALCEEFAPTLSTVSAGFAFKVVAGAPPTGGYHPVTLNCPVDKVLQVATIPPTCVPKFIDKACPPGQFISAIDTNGNPTCKVVPTGTSCGANQYVKTLYTTGAVDCENVILPGVSCPAGQSIQRISASGTFSCI